MKGMDLWDQYNTQEDIEVYTIANKLLHSTSPNDPKYSVYQKEYNIQIFAYEIVLILERLKFDKKRPDEMIMSCKNHNIDVQYCKLRYGEKTSVLLKWHYCIVLFFIEGKDWLKKAIPLILQSSHLNNQMYSSSYLVLAFNLNKLYNCGYDKQINQTAIDLVKQEKDNKFLDRSVKIICSLEKSSKVKKEIHDIIVELSKQHDYPIFENFLKSVIEIAEDKKGSCDKLAKRFENLGDQETEPLKRVMYYKKAQDYYQYDNDALRNISQKIKDSSSEIPFVYTEYRGKITKVDIKGRNNLERIKFLINLFQLLIPQKEKVKQQTKELKQQFPLSSLFTHVKFGDSGSPTSYNSSEEQIEYAEYKRNYENKIACCDIICSISVRPLEGEGKITVNDYVNYLKSFGLHGKSALQLIEHGIKKHYEADYVSSIHILIPQVEYTIRNLLESKGISTLKLSHDIIKNTTLHHLINAGSQIWGDDITEFLKLKLVDMDSINLRNKICHGIYEELENLEGYDALHEFKHQTSLSLILIIVLITKMYSKK